MIYEPTEVDLSHDNWRVAHDANWAKLTACDQEAVKQATMVGRYIQEPYADGYAFYQIIRENKNTVRIRVCTGLGDDWQIPQWGEEATIPKEYATKKLKQRDTLAKLFGQKN